MKRTFALIATLSLLTLTACGGGGGDDGVQPIQPTNPNNNATGGNSSSNSGTSSNGGTKTQIDGYVKDYVMASPATLIAERQQGIINALETTKYQDVLSSDKLNTVSLKTDLGEIKLDLITDGKIHIAEMEDKSKVGHRSMGYAYSRFGYISPTNSRRFYFFHQGEPTPYSNIPKGKATYKGDFFGFDGHAQEYKGTTQFEVDFAERKFTKGEINITEGGKGSIVMTQGFVNLADKTVLSSATNQHVSVVNSGSKENEKNYVLTFTGVAKHNVTAIDKNTGKELHKITGTGQFDGKFYGKNANEMAGSYATGNAAFPNAIHGTFGAKKQ